MEGMRVVVECGQRFTTPTLRSKQRDFLCCSSEREADFAKSSCAAYSRKITATRIVYIGTLKYLTNQITQRRIWAGVRPNR